MTEKYHIWITSNKFSTNQEYDIVEELAAKNYKVAPADGQTYVLSSSASTANIFSILLENSPKKDKDDIRFDLLKILDKLNIEYYSLILSEFTPKAIWTCGLKRLQFDDVVRKRSLPN